MVSFAVDYFFMVGQDLHRQSQKIQSLIELKMEVAIPRAYLLQYFQDYRIIQPHVVFVHGLPSSLANPQTLKQQFSQLGLTLRINLQYLGKDFYSAFVEFQSQFSAALLILVRDSLAKILNDLPLGNRLLRVFYGSTKFCPHFLKEHPCHLSPCNYAHYYIPELTHLKHQAKDIDHMAIAHLLLWQNQAEALYQIDKVKEGDYSNKLFLKLGAQKIERLYLLLGGGQLEPGEERREKEGQWDCLEKEIESQTTSEQDKEEAKEKEKQVDPSKPVQEFLDAAERFLTRLIFESSVFVY